MTGEAGTGKNHRTQDAWPRILGTSLITYLPVDLERTNWNSWQVPFQTWERKKGTLPQLPDFQDLQMDPASALYVLSGTYEDGISEGEAFHKLLSLAFEKGYESARKEKDFFLKESEIIKAAGSLRFWKYRNRP